MLFRNQVTKYFMALRQYVIGSAKRHLPRPVAQVVEDGNLPTQPLYIKDGVIAKGGRLEEHRRG